MDDSGPRRQFAKVKDLALDPFSSGKNDVSDEILIRIKKCLDRANHPTTPEAEAQAALRVAHKLMGQHHVTQADVYSNAIDAGEASKIAGQSTVSIFSNKEKVQKETWTDRVVSAITTFFDCKVYSTVRNSSIDWTFYGIALNTAAAAMSFEMVVNLTQQWASQRKKGNKNSYRLGIASGLSRMAREEKAMEQQRAEEQEAADLAARIKEEELQRKLEIERLKNIESAENQRSVLNIDECVTKVSSDPKLVFLCAALVMYEEAEKKHGTDSTQKENENETDTSPKKYPQVTVKDENEDDNFGTKSGTNVQADLAYDVTFDPMNLDDESDTDDIALDQPFLTFREDDEEALDSTASIDDLLRQHMPTNDPNRLVQSYPDDDPEDIINNQTPEQDPEVVDSEKDTNEEQVITWRSATALTKYRDDAQMIAENYLKDKDMKLKKGRGRDWKIQDWASFDDGKTDSKKIDVKRRRIQDGEAESDEEESRVKRARVGPRRSCFY